MFILDPNGKGRSFGLPFFCCQGRPYFFAFRNMLFFFQFFYPVKIFIAVRDNSVTVIFYKVYNTI